MSKITETVRIFNCHILQISSEELLDELKEGIVFTPNVDHLVRLQNDDSFYQTYKSANYIVCDSRIVQFASRFLGNPIKNVVQGSSFFTKFYKFHKDNPDIKIFLLGAAEGVGISAMGNINAYCNRDIVVGAYSPPYGFEKSPQECEKIIDLLNSSNANVLLVGLGSPKQEHFIAKYHQKFKNIKIFLALGATIDFEAGNVPRAPAIYQKLGVEWLYRLIKEPRRLWRRYLLDDPAFFYYLILQKLGRYKNPFK